ncbi:hypothetical protein [Lactiplantibacillus pentosus]|nr:hypothetical protein [Lactiplantibacillus pentosus]
MTKNGTNAGSTNAAEMICACAMMAIMIPSASISRVDQFPL